MSQKTASTTGLEGSLWRWGIPSAIAVSYGFLALQPDLRTAFPELIATTGLVTVLLAVACTASGRQCADWSPRFILLLALGTRLLFLPRSPELSDDIFRYLWDGLHTLQGVNPYGSAPGQVLPGNDLLRALAPQINHPELVTIYPPVAQLVFAAGAALGGKVLGLKGLLVGLDLLSCALLLRLLAVCRRQSSWGVLYAWHPLPVIEIAGSGHIDGAGVCFLLLGLTLLAAQRRQGVAHPGLAGLLSGASFASAILTKLFPLAFLPATFLLAGRGGRVPLLAGLVLAGGLACGPFWPGLLNAVPTMETYVLDWEFSGFAYQILVGVLPRKELARALLAVAFTVAVVGACWRAWRQGSEPAAVFRACYDVALVFLLLSPTVYPWYALYLACLLPLAGGAAGIALSWAVFLSYRVLVGYALTGHWQESQLMSLLIVLTPVSAALLARLVGPRHCPERSATPSHGSAIASEPAARRRERAASRPMTHRIL